MKNKIKLITASAGSGKTHKLQETLAEFVNPNNPKKIRPEAVIATTFTKKAAQELKERAREALIVKGYFDEAVRLEGALISTVHSVCTKIIDMFCYDSGLSPKIEVLPEDDQTIYFNLALSSVLTNELTEKMYNLENRLFSGDTETDWRKEVSKIIAQARSNGIGTKGLEDSFKHSWESMEKCLPKAMEDAKSYEENIIREGKDIIKQFDVLPKMTKSDKTFHDCLKPFIRNLEKGWNIRWDDWQALGRELDATGKKIATNYQGLLADYLKHPKLHADYKEYLKELFNTAGQALDAYQTYKKERGLVDYVDMECIVSDLLKDKNVQQRISEEFDLLMVDEFQDTSPIQLGIFLKLSKLIPNVIWVGDQKQSIYGFRGSDPALMTALLEKMKHDLDIDTLGNSYRSRPDLVHHTNALFTKAFKGLLPEDQIKLSPTRINKDGHKTALEIWRVQKAGKVHSKDRSLPAIAKEIKAMIDEKRIIAQKNKPEEIIREITYKDVAFLSLSNDGCADMAYYLTQLGLPVSLEQTGLLALPESKLLMSALRYYAFPSDSLAIMELKLLIEGKDNVEDLIEERVKYVSENKYSEYGKDFWAVTRIDELRKLSLTLSPVEVVNHLLVKLELERVVGSWEGHGNRWNNLILFRENAHKFEEYCQRLKVGATLGGFLLWLQERDEEGLLCYGGNEENAITVMTWHKSKGLEWPVVVLSDCHKEMKKSCFGLKVVSLDKDIDLDNPLKGRVLRYWFSFLQRSRTKAQFLNLVNASDVAKNNTDMCLKEGKRLLYVGMTRARDYLVLPLDSGAEAQFISEVLEDENADLPKDSGEQMLTWASDCKSVLVKHVMEVSEPLKEVESAKGRKVIKAFKGPEVFEPYLVNPSKQIPVQGATAKLFGTYGHRLTVKAHVDDDKLGDCLHDIAAIPQLGIVDVERVLKNYKFEDVFEAHEILNQMELFETFMAKTGFKNAQRELPVTGNFKGQLVNGVIDLLMEDGDGNLIIVDHKSYRGSKLQDKAASYSGQLKIYSDSFQLSKRKETKIMIHFVSLGEIYEICLGNLVSKIS